MSKRQSERIVYVSEGDIFTKDIPSGSVRRLTRDGANHSPKWSPSGKWIAFLHSLPSGGDKLHLIQGDGAIRHTLPEAQETYSFSLVSEEIAAVTEDDSLKIFSFAGNTIRRVISGTQQKRVLGVSWSPDGRFLAYTIQNQTTFPKERFSISLWLQEATGNSAPRLLYRSLGHEAAPWIAGWTADCRVLLFWALHYYPAGSINSDGLPLYACTISKTTPTIRRLTGKSYESMVLAQQEQIGFANQGNNIAISVGGGRFLGENKRIALVHSLTGSLRFVTPRRLSATFPVWSPDNKQIAYLAAPAIGENYVEGAFAHSSSQRHLSVMNANGTNQRSLSDARVHDPRVGATMGPRWLQDGRHLLFSRVDAKARESLWMIGIDGSGLRCLVPHIGNPDDYSGHSFDVWISSSN